MVLRPRRFLPSLLVPLFLLAALVAAPVVARADTLSWSRTYAGPADIPDPGNDDIPVAGALNGVSFADANRGWAVGVRVENAGILGGTRSSLFAFTSDGGSTWTSGTVGGTAELYGVVARSTSDVWAVGASGTIAHYNGFSWSIQTVPSWPATRALRAVAFAGGSSNGWAVGDGLGVVRTTDGGATWSMIATPTPSQTSAYRAVTSVSATGAVAVGDAGKTRRLGTSGPGTPGSASVSEDLHGVAFTDSTKGWAVGNDSRFVKTADGGTTWTVFQSPPPPAGFVATQLDLRSVAFAGPLDGIAVGTYQMVWRTFDGGATWAAEQLDDPTTGGDFELRSVAFAGGSADTPVTVARAYNLQLSSSAHKTRAYLGTWSDRTPPPPVAPAAPTGVSIADAGAETPSIVVTWNDASSDEDGFVVQRAAGSAAGPYSTVKTLVAGVTSWTDTGVDLTSTWYYRVSSYRGALSSAWVNATPSGLKLDTTPPTTTSDAVGTYVASATITLSADDPGGSGIQNTFYVIDGGVQREGMTVHVSGAGPHTVEFWSVDLAGNVEVHKSAAFTITAPDTTAPVTTSDVVNPNYVGGAVIRLTATDAGGSGVASTYYKLDGGVQTAGTTVSTSVLGSHTLEFWSVDVAGNIESPHNTVDFGITAPPVPDTTKPVTTSDAKASYVGSAVINLHATDNVGVQYTYYVLDSGTPVLETTIIVPGVGSHVLEFWSVDFAGNVETHKTATFVITAPPVIDTIAPVTTSDAKASYVGTATIRLSATDNFGVTGTYYILDGGLPASGTTIIVSPVGAHSLGFWSTDAAGNPEVHKTAIFTVTAVPTSPVATTLSLKASATSLRVGKYVTLTGSLKGGVPAGSHVRYQVRLPGKKTYTTLSSTRDVSATGVSSLRYKLAKKGTYYFQARFLGVAGFNGSISKAIKVVVK